jgi:hypothetical protein
LAGITEPPRPSSSLNISLDWNSSSTLGVRFDWIAYDSSSNNIPVTYYEIYASSRNKLTEFRFLYRSNASLINLTTFMVPMDVFSKTPFNMKPDDILEAVYR